MAKSRREAKEGDAMMGKDDPEVTADHRPEERDQTRAERFFCHRWGKQPWRVTSRWQDSGNFVGLPKESGERTGARGGENIGMANPR